MKKQKCPKCEAKASDSRFAVEEADRVLAIHKRDYEAHFKAHQEELAIYKREAEDKEAWVRRAQTEIELHKKNAAFSDRLREKAEAELARIGAIREKALDQACRVADIDIYNGELRVSGHKADAPELQEWLKNRENP